MYEWTSLANKFPFEASLLSNQLVYTWTLINGNLLPLKTASLLKCYHTASSLSPHVYTHTHREREEKNTLSVHTV